MLILQQYRKSYDGRLVLAVDDLQLEPGMYWLQGPNGAGKTTLLRSIAGLIPFDGTISANGANIRRDRIAYTKAVSWADAEPLYPAFLTGNDLLHFYRNTKRGSREQETDLLRRFAAEGYMNKPVGSWSSGMVKKLSLVLAFMGNPRWVILDEPFITLDAKAQATLRNLLETFVAGGGGVLLSSHQDPGGKVDLLHLCDQTVIR